MTKIFSILLSIVGGDHEKAAEAVKTIELPTYHGQEIQWEWPIIVGGLIIVIIAAHFISKRIGVWKKKEDHHEHHEGGGKKRKVRKKKLHIHQKAPY
jgi:hypothetical protein